MLNFAGEVNRAPRGANSASSSSDHASVAPERGGWWWGCRTVRWWLSGVSAQDRSTAASLALRVVGSGGSPEDVVRAMAPLHVSGWLFPGDTLVSLAVGALAESGASRVDPLEAGSLYKEFLPECQFSGKTARAKSSYALRAVAMFQGGVRPDLGEDAGWYQADDFWLYAAYASSRTSERPRPRSGRSVGDVCEAIRPATALSSGHAAPAMNAVTM